MAKLVDVEFREKEAPVREELDPERGARGEDVAGSRAAAEHANLGNGRVYLSCDIFLYKKIYRPAERRDPPHSSLLHSPSTSGGCRSVAPLHGDKGL